MIISVAIVIGFKDSISKKVMGFSAHIKLVPFDNNVSTEGKPIKIDTSLINKIHKNVNVSHIQYTAQKAGLVKTDNQIYGIILEGVDGNYDSSFLMDNIIDGHFPDVASSKKTNEVIISSKISNILGLNLGDDVRIWFIDKGKAQARGRKLIVSGIYNTGMEEFDNMYIIGDLRQIQKLNNWNADEVGNIEIQLKNPEKINQTAMELYNAIPYNLSVTTIYNEFPQIFSWLGLLDMNVVVLLTLLIIVATITMISTLLIIIIERTNMIGLLKVLGSTNYSIRKIFIYKASQIIFTGMLFGNIIGLLFYFLQLHTKIISLPAESYYVDYVPVKISFAYVALLNAGTFIVSVLVLIIPSFYITRIVPAKALRYE